MLFLDLVIEFYYILENIVLTIAGIFIVPKDCTEGDKRPVVMIPGFGGSRLTMHKWGKHLNALGYPTYYPQLYFQLPSLHKNMRRLEKYLVDKNLKDCYIAAHSMGGLIAASLGHEGNRYVRKIFSVSSPFRGTYLGAALFFIPSGRQVIPNSRYMKMHREGFLGNSKIQYIYAKADPVICPAEKNRLGKKTDMLSPFLGHFRTCISTKGVEFLVEIISEEDKKTNR